MEISIRAAAESDMELVFEAASKEGWSTYSQRQDALRGALKLSTMMVAYDSDVFVGFARAISDGFVTTFLCEVLVVEEYRNRGIGSMLVHSIWELFSETRLDLISDADGFYEKLNFRKVGSGFRISKWQAQG
ncbi:MAG: GNAT family N-acetyltransferase [Coriobacteriia bacterium]|nr:GNAT family N-acetyltransferase [Coriobacteriia bacterium]